MINAHHQINRSVIIYSNAIEYESEMSMIRLADDAFVVLLSRILSNLRDFQK